MAFAMDSGDVAQTKKDIINVLKLAHGFNRYDDETFESATD